MKIGGGYLKAYEGMFIFDPNMKKEDLDALIADIEADIKKNQGKVEEIIRLGRRRLEHKIGRSVDGFYCLMNFYASAETVQKMNPKLRLNESILRYMVVDRDRKGFSSVKSFEEERIEKPAEEKAQA